MDFDTMGEVLGEDDIATVGALAKALQKSGASSVATVLRKVASGAARPAWRNQLAPGVGMPGEGMEPLPLTPQANGGVFTAAVTAIEFLARPQRPFRPERLLTNVRRTGAAGTLILATGFFVGTQLQQAQRGNLDIEQFGPTAFGVRLQFIQGEPGVDIAVPCIAAPAPAGADTVAVSMMFLGRTVR